MAISMPPPMACPLMAAMTGLGNRSIFRITLLPNRMNCSMSPPENAEPRSAPPQKILSPAPVRITARTDSSLCTELSAALTSVISASLMAFAGGRLSVMSANVSSRASVIVSNPIACDSFEEDVRDRLSGVGEAVAALAQDPGRRDLVHGTEQHLGRDLDRQIPPKDATRHALVQDGADQLEVRGDLVRRCAPEKLLPLPQLDLHDLGHVGARFQHLEVQPHEPADLRLGIVLARDLRSQSLHEGRHLLAEERDQDLVLGLEIEIDGAAGDAGLPCDVGHARVVEAVAREDAHGGVDDLLRLVGIAHALTEPRFILRSVLKRCQRVLQSAHAHQVPDRRHAGALARRSGGARVSLEA